MQKLVKTTTSDLITIDEICKKLDEDYNDHIVFYYSNNKGNPVFLKQLKKEGSVTNSYRPFYYAFISPIFSYGESFLATSVRGSIEQASISREIFICKKEEWEQIFTQKLKK